MARPTIDDRLTRPRHRRGMSYLEVLIAAGIGLAGLLGAIAIFPVAILNMQRGVVADTTAYIGPSALDQIQVMGISRPTTWIDSATSSVVQVSALQTNYSARPNFGNRIWRDGVSEFDSFCFDPRFVAEITSSGYDATKLDPTKFPYWKQATTADVRMRRMTLGNGSGGALTTNHARLLFKSNDDLIVTKPDDPTAPAILAPLMGKSATPVRRDYMGDFEWIVTATPQIALLTDTIPGTPPTPPVFYATGTYELSVVIFHQRNPRLDTIQIATDATTTDDERVVDVEFLSNGYNGGEVTIQTRSGQPISDLNIQVGQWVMLSAMTYKEQGSTAANVSSGGFTPAGALFHWYRIVGFSEVYAGNRRDVTLEGPDWPVQPGGVNRAAIPSLSSGVVTTRMTICSGVVGVFRQTIKLEP